MRTLKFIVEGQRIRPDPKCDFTNLVPGTDGYLQVEFAFSKEWDGCAKVTAFYSRLGKEYRAQILEDGKTCKIPAEACKREHIWLKVMGKSADGTILQTNRTLIHQDGGRA
jgi:hypothetical protein